MKEKRKIQPLPAPLLWPAIFWTVGLLTGYHLDLNPLWILLAAGLLLVLGIVSRVLRPAAIILLFLCFGSLHMQSHRNVPDAFTGFLQERGKLQQECSWRVVQKLGESSYEVELQEIAGFEISRKLLFYSDEKLREGSAFKALALIRPLIHDHVLDIYPQKYQGFLKPLGLVTELEGQNSLSLIQKARGELSWRLDLALGEHAGLAKALILSDSNFKREHRQSLSRAGITHLVVVSGLHVLILGLFLLSLLRSLFPRRMAELLFMLSLLAFAALNNWAPPIVRAMLMINLALLANWLSRPFSIAQNLSLSLLIITIVSPLQITSLSFQFSFLAVALIAFALPRISLGEKPGRLRVGAHKLGSYMLLTLVVGIGLAPFTLYYFGTASLNGILANLLGLPLVAALLILSILILILPLKAYILCFHFFADIWQAWLDFCAGLPLLIEGEWISLPSAIAMGLVLLLLLMVLKGKWRWLMRLVLPVGLVAAALLLWPKGMQSEVYFFRSGVSDCFLIFADDGSSLMIDTGGLIGVRAETDMCVDDPAASWLGKSLLPWLRRRGMKSLDYLLITHLHSDHAGGMRDLMQSVQVQNLILSRHTLESSLWKELSPRLDLKDCRIIAISDTTGFALGSHRLKILHPDARYEDANMNNQSIVCRYDSPGARYLFTGDIEADAERWLAQNYPRELPADVLKVPHHGSRSSSTPDFINWVQPQTAIIPVSEGNVYGFPQAEVIKRLQAIGADIRLTHDGSIRLPISEFH